MPEGETIDQMRARKGCRCPSFRGLTWTELRDLGQGCTSSGICPVLDKHRRAVMATVTKDQRVAEDLRLAQELGIGRGVSA